MIAGCLLAAAMTVGEFGAWRLEFEDGSRLAASAWKGTVSESVQGGVTRRDWRSPDLDVTVTAEPAGDGRRDFRISLVNRGVKAVSSCEFPARRRFAPESVKRFVYPGRGNYGLGMAFNAKFFRPTGDKRRPYLSYRVQYPTLFADFAFLETVDGSTVAVYGLQPRTGIEPWENRTPFNPGATGVGGDAKGGWYDHSFALWAKVGGTWTSPKVRIASGLTLEAALADYAAANGFRRTLADKVKDAATLERLKRAPLVLTGDVTTETLMTLQEALPVPTLVHTPSFLHGGFDKQYPDVLPPNPKFGTQARFREVVDALRARGHVFCPYTNPTWWCDEPRGPTFRKWGDGALAIQRDGRWRREAYGPRNRDKGFVQTYFHPGSHEGNRRTVRQFVEEIPADLLFEDQTGGRDWIWDFNPASPSPTAHSEGMLSMVQEHARSLPIAAEDGWDHLAEYNTALMGCTWRLVPMTPDQMQLPLFKEDFPADTWTIEPVSLRLFHDKCLFYMHNLGLSVRHPREAVWMLALGFQMSFRTNVQRFLGVDPHLNTDRNESALYDYVHLLQKEVVSRLAGEPLVAFRHDREPLIKSGKPLARLEDDGVIEATYGKATVQANLGDVPRTVGGKRLAPYGFFVEAPGLTAAWLEGEDPFVETKDGKWVYAKVFDAGSTPVVVPKDAPCRTAPGAQVAVLDLGADAPLCGTRMRPAEWTKALEPFAATTGVRVARLTSAEALQAALAAGPTQWLAVVNPYGENFPCVGAGRGLETVEAVRAYVRAGGHWFETAGAPFNVAIFRGADGKWQQERMKGRQLDALQISIVPFGDLPGKPMRLEAAQGADWLPPSVRELLKTRTATLARGVAGTEGNPLDPVLVTSKGLCWFGGVRLGGVGALWRLGGVLPDAPLATAAVAATLERIWRVPPSPVPSAFVRRVRRVR